MTEQTSTGDLFANPEGNIKPLAGMAIKGSIGAGTFLEDMVKCLVMLGAQDKRTA